MELSQISVSDAVIQAKGWQAGSVTCNICWPGTHSTWHIHLVCCEVCSAAYFTINDIKTRGTFLQHSFCQLTHSDSFMALINCSALYVS